MPQTLARLMSFVRSWLLRSRMEREMDREMRFHIEARAADLEAEGFAAADARRRAGEEFGDVIRWKEAGREARGLTLVDDLAADLRYAGRTMRRSPGFTAAAVLSLAFGIGATTGIFGLFDLLLLRPLPVRDAGDLVHVTTAGTSEGTSGSSNYPWFQEVASRTDLFSDAMLVRHDVYKVTIEGRVEPITGQRVTTNYHRLLGVSAILGRTLTAADRPEAGAPPVAVISHRLWQQRFGGSADVIGATIAVDRQPYTIVGVSRPGFGGVLVGWTTDLTMPLDTTQFMERGNWSTMPLIARLRPGVGIEEAQRQLDPMLTRFVAAGTTDPRAQRFRSRYLQRTSLTSAETGISDLRERFSRPIQLLMAAVALLLLIACVNLAGLLVARNATRQHEIGMRLALGAGRGRIVRQLLTESGALALLGSLLGLVLALRGANAVIALMPPQFGPLSLELAPDARVLAFALVATVATTLLAGLLPAWQAARTRVLTPTHHGASGASTAPPRVGRALVVAQLALSLVLVAGAVLCVRTLVNLGRVETGFDRSRLLVVMIDPQGSGYEGDRLRVLQRETLAALGSVPGVQQATLSTGSPFSGNVDGKRLAVPGVAPRDADDTIIQTNLVGPGYFDALQIPVVGRAIDERDRERTQRVAVVSESFARRFFGDVSSAVGRSFEIGLEGVMTPHEIVGVARETRYQTLRAPSERLVYLPWFQADDVRSTSFEFIVRTGGPPASWIEPVREAMQRVRRDVPILAIQPMTAIVNGRLMSERLLAMLGTFFAVGALMLAALGVYGLLAHLVARRVAEFGVRLALGAQRREIVWMTLRENLLLAAAGCAAGIVGALAGLRVLEELLFGLTPTDTVNLLAAAAILVLVSLAAALAPARRAASVDPLVALRSE